MNIFHGMPSFLWFTGEVNGISFGAPAYFFLLPRPMSTHARSCCCCPSLLRSGCWLHAHPSVCRTDAGRRRCQAVDHHGAAATSSSSSRPSARSSSASPRPQPPPGDRPRPSSATSAARHAAAAVAAEVEEARRDRDEAEAKVREVLSRQSASRLEEAEEDVRREVELKESTQAHASELEARRWRAQRCRRQRRLVQRLKRPPPRNEPKPCCRQRSSDGRRQR